MLALRPASTSGAAITTGARADPRAVATTAVVAALAAAHAGVDAVSGSISALLPTLESRFDLSGSAIATLLATLSASSMLAQPVVGRVADRFGARAVTAGGAVVAAALLSLLGVVDHLAVVYALLVVGGLGSAGFHPAAAAAARRILPERAALAVSVFSIGGTIGMAFGPLLLLALIANAGIGFTPLLMVPGVLLGTALWRVLPADRPVVAGRAPRGRARLLRGPVGPIAAATMFVALASTTFHAGLPLWFAERADTAGDQSLVGWSFAAFDAAAVVGALLAGWAGARVAPARLASMSLAVAPAALIATITFTPGSTPFFVSCAAAGALMSAAGPMFMVAAQDRAGTAVAAASGLVGFAVGTAGIAFIGIGVLADVAGLGVALPVGFAAVLPAAAIAARALDRTPTPVGVLEAIAAGCGCGCSACPTA